MSLHIKKGDEVVVISGAAKGEKGTILRVFPKKERVLIEGVNLRVRHVRPKKQGEKGQTVRVPTPIHASNVKKITKSNE